MRHEQDAPKSAADRAHWDAVEEATELLHEERFREALVALRDVIRNDPQNPYAFYFLGVALYESGELETARDAYKACLRLSPRHLGARVSLCHVQRALGELEDAVRTGLEALEQAPGDADALYALGLAYLARGDDAAARRCLSAFLETKPELEVALEVQQRLAGLGPQGDSN